MRSCNPLSRQLSGNIRRSLRIMFPGKRKKRMPPMSFVLELPKWDNKIQPIRRDLLKPSRDNAVAQFMKMCGNSDSFSKNSVKCFTEILFDFIYRIWNSMFQRTNRKIVKFSCVSLQSKYIFVIFAEVFLHTIFIIDIDYIFTINNL